MSNRTTFIKYFNNEANITKPIICDNVPARFFRNDVAVDQTKLRNIVFFYRAIYV